MDAVEPVAAQRARIQDLADAFWRSPEQDRLAELHSAWRELESLVAQRGPDLRHRLVILVPVADSPVHLAACLDSLLSLCRAFGYGGMREGLYRKVSVLLADDSADADSIARNRTVAERVRAEGLAVEYFGPDEQRALLDRLDGIDLAGGVGEPALARGPRKGQGVMRNVAALRLAEIAAAQADEPLLFFSVDADQRFGVDVPGRPGATLFAVNYLAELDRLFAAGDIEMLSGKVVGDPPVSPAVMAGNLLEDLVAFLAGMHGRAPGEPYPQPGNGQRGSGEAAYHDMVELFGFARQAQPYPYRCRQPGAPDNAACFAELAARLGGFFHGEHPTRLSGYVHAPGAVEALPARTVYTGNYVFTPAALRWFIPFAPLRLRMSGPTMGRLLQSALGARFATANLPLLHCRTLETTHSAEFRPGVVAEGARVDLADEFERQFFGDVMLFTMPRLVESGYPERPLSRSAIEAELAAVCDDMLRRYEARQAEVRERLAALTGLLRDPAAWWQSRPALANARAAFEDCIANIEHNFGPASGAMARVRDAAVRATWLERQAAALDTLDADRLAWRAALERLGQRP
jgi:hypothetical protein